MSARDTQVGGAHYKKMAIQVTEFAERNGWTPCPANILKYVCRHQDKNGREDLEKCLHYVDLRAEFTPLHNRSRQNSIAMYRFIRENGYYGRRAECLHRLAAWADNGLFADQLKAEIALYADECYPKNC